MSSSPEKPQSKPSPPDPWQAETPERAPKPTWRDCLVRLLPLLAVMTFALVVRGGVLWKMERNLYSDPDGYRFIAENLLSLGEYGSPRSLVYMGAAGDGGEPSARRPPLYPMLLSKFAVDGEVTRLNVALLHLGLGVATVGLVFVVSQRLHLGSWGTVAAVLVACDPILLQQSTLVMTETLAAFLAALALYLLTRTSDDGRAWNAMLAGGALGLAVLCRPTFLIWLVACACAMPVLRGFWTQRLVRTAAILLAALVVLSPWAVRNWLAFGSPIITTTHGGYTLALANNPSLYEHLRSGHPLAEWGVEDLQYERTWELYAGQRLDGIWLWETRYIETFGRPPTGDWYERAEDAYCYEVAFRTIRDDPAMFAYSSVLRLGQLWSPLPNPSTHSSTLLRYAVAVWYIGVYALALVGIVRLRWRILQTPWVWGVLLALSFTLVHTFYWTNLRMRAPVMPFVCLLAAVGAGWLWDLLVRRKRLSHSELETAR
jgi:4-amino-4-deoxy-L-arabinose transferase-like glycosyltransferase